jgi:hypothetical protein
MRLCPYCHTEVIEDAPFCPECRRPLAVTGQAVPITGQAVEGKSKKKLAGIIGGCIIAVIVIAVLATSREALPRPTIDYLPTNWKSYISIPYEARKIEGAYDDRCGMISYMNQVSYDGIVISYERAPNWDLTPSALEQDANDVFQESVEHIPDETGILTIAGTTAGYAKGCIDADRYRLQVVLVLDQVYMCVFSNYHNIEDEDQILDMIDSISLVG